MGARNRYLFIAEALYTTLMIHDRFMLYRDRTPQHRVLLGLMVQVRYDRDRLAALLHQRPTNTGGPMKERGQEQVREAVALLHASWKALLGLERRQTGIQAPLVPGLQQLRQSVSKVLRNAAHVANSGLPQSRTDACR